MRQTASSGHYWHDFWVAFFVIVVAGGLFMGQGLVIGFGLMGLVAGAISWAWNRLALDDVTYERHLPLQRVFLGEEVSMTVALTNKKPVPLAWIRVDDELPDALMVVGGDVSANVRPKIQALRHQTSMAWYERIHWDYRLRCTQRGLYRIGPASIESGDPFGFLRSRRNTPHQDYLMVYPKVYALEELDIPPVRPLGDVKGGLQICPDPSRPSGHRDYERGDPLKTVDWKATARMQRLQVRTYEPSSMHTVILVVAVDTTTPFWGAYLPKDLELVITAAASVAAYAAERRYNVGLFSNDVPVMLGTPMTVPPSMGREQLSVILGALATIRPYALGPMSSHLARHYRRFPFGATVVVSTAFLPPEFVDTLRDLRQRGYKIVVVYVGDEDCPELAEGIIVYKLRDHLTRLEAEGEALAG